MLAMATVLEKPAGVRRAKRRPARRDPRSEIRDPRKASSSWQPHPRQQGRESQGLSRGIPWGEVRWSLLFQGDRNKKGRVCPPQVAPWRTGVNTWLTKGEGGKSQGSPWLTEHSVSLSPQGQYNTQLGILQQGTSEAGLALSHTPLPHSWLPAHF